jgi:hypothetical protein
MMNRHAIRGEEAAALATIKRCERATPMTDSEFTSSTATTPP